MIEIYICAYPKSGVTWLVHLLSDLLDSPQQDTPDGPVIGCWGVRCDGGYVVRKSHDAYSERFYGLPVVLIQRDPRDVIVSTSFYLRWSMNTSINRVLADYEAWLRPWLDHCTVATRYRWLHDRPVDELRRMAQAITGQAPDDARIRETVDRQRFDRMVEQLRSDRHFMRRGLPGDWRNHLTQAQGRRIHAVLGGWMLEQGFIENGDWWKNELSR